MPRQQFLCNPDQLLWQDASFTMPQLVRKAATDAVINPQGLDVSVLIEQTVREVFEISAAKAVYA